MGVKNLREAEIFLAGFCFVILVISCGCIENNGNGTEEENLSPTATASANPVSGIAPLTVSFMGYGTDSDGNIVSYYWDFNDGTTSNQQNPTHIFQYGGTYTVELTVKDNDGAKGTDTITIIVEADSDGDGIPDTEDAFPNDPSEWQDTDGDGHGDNSDAFPNDPSEWKDSDNDGTGDNADPDDDNDGYLDTEDLFPYKDAKVLITIKKFKVIDYVDPGDGQYNAQIYFKIYIDDDYKTTLPAEGYIWDVDVGELRTVNSKYTWNAPDNVATHTINIRMYDSDDVFDDILDIDGHDDSSGLSVTYNIGSQTWTGDDTDGVTDGSDDGTQYSDDDDCYLEYDIETV